MAKHAKHAAQPDNARVSDTPAAEEQVQATVEIVDFIEPPADEPPVVSKHVLHHRKKSRRTRVVLSIVIVLLVCLLGILGFFLRQMFTEAQQVAQSYPEGQVVESSGVETVSDASSDTHAHHNAPSLINLIGLPLDSALAQIGSDAVVTNESEITQETGSGSKKKTEVVGKNITISTGGSAESRANAISVYLTLDKEGVVTEAGYSASLGSLGFGDLSFADAVKEQHIVELLVTEAGVSVDEGTVELPAVEDFRTYGSDGSTIAQEQYTFAGKGTGTDGMDHTWTCRLSYDYSAANVSQNLADTVRQVYVYIA